VSDVLDGQGAVRYTPRSRSDTAQVNELLCKVLCHNRCVLIQSMYELGTEQSSERRLEGARCYYQLDAAGIPIPFLSKQIPPSIQGRLGTTRRTYLRHVQKAY
jgi:hypothetical protein